MRGMLSHRSNAILEADSDAAIYHKTEVFEGRVSLCSGSKLPDCLITLTTVSMEVVYQRPRDIETITLTFLYQREERFSEAVLPLRIPICAFDAKTGILCGKCQAKLSAGQISNSDIVVSKALVKLAESVPEVNKMTLLRSNEVEGSYVMEMEPSDASLLRSKPEIKQKLDD